MKIAACDFDGTLYRNKTIDPADLSAIAAWRSEGNAFGIVTGRGCSTLLRDMGPFRVPYDFLVCNNGAMICGRDAQGLYFATLPRPVRDMVIAHPGMEAATQCAFFAGPALYAHAGKVPYWILPQFPLPQMAPEVARTLPLHQISLAYPDAETSAGWAAELQAMCAGCAGVHCSSICIDITAPDVSKATGMERLVRQQQWKPADVLVIGDDFNDLSMIRHFHGFAVDTAAPDVREAAADVFPSVGGMLQACKKPRP